MGYSVRDKYIQYRTNPDNDERSDAYFCTTHSVPLDDLRTMQRGDIKLEKDILHARRDTYSKRMNKIDEALFMSKVIARRLIFYIGDSTGGLGKRQRSQTTIIISQTL